MERRHFLKLALGFVAGGAALAASAQAAPLMPAPLVDDGKLPANPDAQPAVTSGDEVDRLTPEEVRWGRGRRVGPWSRLGSPALGLAAQRVGLAPPQVLGLASPPPPLLAPPSPLLAPPLLLVSQCCEGRDGTRSPCLCFVVRCRSIFGVVSKFAPVSIVTPQQKSPASSEASCRVLERLSKRGSVHSATRCRTGTHGRAVPRRRREPDAPRRPAQAEPRRLCEWAGSRHRDREPSRGRIRPRRSRR